MNDVERDLRRRLKKSIRKRTELNNIVLGYQKENQQLKEKLEASEKARKEAIELLHIAYGISVDYDGFNDVIGLKLVIDDMTRCVKKAKKVLDLDTDKGE